MADAPVSAIRLRDTHRLISSRYPSVGIFDAITVPEDLEAVIELAGWTDDRISAELGVLRTIPAAEWVVGPMASVVMAAFCHPDPRGARFNDARLGAWYASRALETAHAEVIHRRTHELEEIGLFDARVQMRQYLADFNAEFHDIRGDDPSFAPLYHPDSYRASQTFAVRLRVAGSNGVLYRSVRHPGGECVACFRPRLVTHVRAAAHFEYRWSGARLPSVMPIG